VRLRTQPPVSLRIIHFSAVSTGLYERPIFITLNKLIAICSEYTVLLHSVETEILKPLRRN